MFQGQADESVVEENSVEIVVEKSTTIDVGEEYQQILAKVTLPGKWLDPERSMVQELKLATGRGRETQGKSKS